MRPPKILLRVRSEVGCPLFRAGDQMMIDGPAVDRAGSTNVCALALAKFVHERLLASGETCEKLGESGGGEFCCPRPENPVTFEVVEVAEVRGSAPMMAALTTDLGQAVATLRTVPVFRALPAAVLGKLAAEIRIETYREGEVVVEKGTLGRAFHVVHSGTLEVIGYAEQEVSTVVTRLKPRDSFGEMSLLTGAPTAASVVAKTPVTLLSIPKQSFEALLHDNAYLSSAFTRLLAARLMATNLLLVKEGSKPFSGKLQEMNLPTVLQILSESHRSGTLVIDNYQGKRLHIGLNLGRVFTVELGELEGEAALFEALRWSKGDFWLDKKRVPAEDRVDCSITGLLLEGMRRLDEGDRPAEAPPPAQADGASPSATKDA